MSPGRAFLIVAVINTLKPVLGSIPLHSINSSVRMTTDCRLILLRHCLSIIGGGASVHYFDLHNASLRAQRKTGGFSSYCNNKKCSLEYSSIFGQRVNVHIVMGSVGSTRACIFGSFCGVPVFWGINCRKFFKYGPFTTNSLCKKVYNNHLNKSYYWYLLVTQFSLRRSSPLDQ